MLVGSALLVFSPLFAMVLVHTNMNLDGSWLALWERIVRAGFVGAMLEALPTWPEIFQAAKARPPAPPRPATLPPR